MKQCRWVADASPAHVGNVKQTVHALEVNKGAEVSDIFDLTFHLVANLDTLQEVLAHLSTLALDHLAAGEHDVLALIVDLHNFKFVDLAEILVEILRRDDVNLRAGQEGFHTDVDHEATLDGTLDLAFDKSTLMVDSNNFLPVLTVSGFLLGENNHALVVFELDEKHFHFITFFDFLIFKFSGRDGTL